MTQKVKRGGARPGAGRPRREGGEMKPVGFRADAASRKELATIAKASGKTVSAFIRDAVLHAVAAHYVTQPSKTT